MSVDIPRLGKVKIQKNAKGQPYIVGKIDFGGTIFRMLVLPEGKDHSVWIYNNNIQNGRLTK